MNSIVPSAPDTRPLHHYSVDLTWTGNTGEGTTGYTAYGRNHELSAPGHVTIPASAEEGYRGDPTRWNPEELLLSTVAQCHMLWYLHLASAAGIVITQYTDSPTGAMAINPDGSADFTHVTLNPRVTITDPALIDLATQIHGRVGEKCVIARSVRFPVHHDPVTIAS